MINRGVQEWFVESGSSATPIPMNQTFLEAGQRYPPLIPLTEEIMR